MPTTPASIRKSYDPPALIGAAGMHLDGGAQAPTHAANTPATNPVRRRSRPDSEKTFPQP